MLRGVRVFVLRVPVVLEYSHDLHAKKKAPLHRLAMWVAKAVLERLYRCWSS